MAPLPPGERPWYDKSKYGLCGWTAMELKDVLAQVPGLEKRFVYYLESLGYIQPTRVPKRRIARRISSSVTVITPSTKWRM